MMYSLNINSDGRILSATEAKYCNIEPLVEKLPEGDISDYKYLNAMFVYDPLPKNPDKTPGESSNQWDEMAEAVRKGVDSV